MLHHGHASRRHALACAGADTYPASCCCLAKPHPPCPALLPLLEQKAEVQLDAALAYKSAFLDGYLGEQLAALWCF